MDVVDLVSDEEEDFLNSSYVKQEYVEEGEQMDFGDQDGYFSEYTEEPMVYINQDQTEQTDSAPKSFACDICSKVCNNRQSLWYHKKSHNPTPPVSCSVCQKVFLHTVSLSKHMRSHGKEMNTASSTSKPHNMKDIPAPSQAIMKKEAQYEGTETLQNFTMPAPSEEINTNQAEKSKDVADDGPRFYCTECPRSYKQDYNLTRHFRLHKVSGAFSCDICGMCFKKEVSLKCHKWRHSEGKYQHRTQPRSKIKRRVQGSPQRVFPRLAKTAANTSIQQQQNPVRVVQIQTAAKSPATKRSKKFNPKHKRHYCPKCPTSFKHQRNLSRHILLHYRPGDYPCDICGICFNEERSMNLHRSKHGPLAVPKAPENTEQTEWESFGEQYTITMEEEEDEVKEEGEFKEEGEIKEEGEVEDAPSFSKAIKKEITILKCSICCASFKLLENFERHMRWKHNIEPNEPDYSHKAEPMSEDEQVYEVKPKYYELPVQPHYQCEFCKRNFLEKDMHDRHLEAAHWGMIPSAKPVKRDYQDRERPTTSHHIPPSRPVSHPASITISVPNTITAHPKGEKKMHCTVCSYSFFTKHALSRHMDTHNEMRKLHPCHLCGLEYSWYHDLQTHLKQHARGELIAKCPQCEGRFKTMRGVHRHVGMKHRKIARGVMYNQKLQFKIKKRPRVIKVENVNGSNTMVPVVPEAQVTQAAAAQEQPTDESTGGKLRCTICFDLFATKPSLNRHMKAHNPHRKMHTCRLCGLQYFWYQDLHSHLRKHERGELPAKCPHCNGRFRTEKGVGWHIARHHKFGSHVTPGSPRIKKTFAPVKTTMFKNFKLIKKENEKKYQCNICYKGFSDKFVLRDHMALHNANRQKFLCPQCGLDYLWQRNLQAHIKLHNQGKLNSTCPKCKGKFQNKKGVLRHMSKKHKGPATMQGLDEEEYVQEASDIPVTSNVTDTTEDPDGNQVYYSVQSVNEATGAIKEEDRYLASTSGQFQCNICPSFFFDSNTLEQHMETHKDTTQHTKQMYTCPHCGLKYSWPSDLAAHVKRHERGELTIKCLECDGQFKTQIGLLRHVNATHKERRIAPIVAPVVPHSIIITPNIKKMLQRGSNLIKRKYKPTTDGNFRCTVCNKLFHNNNNLKRHMLVHNPNRKMYPCLVCGLEYSWYQDMQYHMMQHERGELQAACPHCGARFKSEKGVMRHISMKHRDEM